MEETRGRCKYCGNKAQNNGFICSECRVKLKLVRKMQQMIKDTFERVRRID